MSLAGMCNSWSVVPKDSGVPYEKSGVQAVGRDILWSLLFLELFWSDTHLSTLSWKTGSQRNKKSSLGQTGLAQSSNINESIVELSYFSTSSSGLYRPLSIWVWITLMIAWLWCFIIWDQSASIFWLRVDLVKRIRVRASSTVIPP